MRMNVEETGRADHAFDGENIRIWRNDQTWRDVHGIRIAGFTDADNLAVENANIAFDDAE